MFHSKYNSSAHLCVSEDVKGNSGEVAIPRGSRADWARISAPPNTLSEAPLWEQFGGGKGAAVGALVGGAGGTGAQVYTGRKKVIPAETELKYKLAEDLQLRPVRTRAAGAH